MRILYLTHRLPFAPNRGDRIRAYHMLRQMSRVASVSLFSLIHDDEEAAELSRVRCASPIAGARVGRLRGVLAGAARLASSRPLTHSLLDAPDATRVLEGLAREHPPDLVVAYCSSMARFALAPPLDRYPFVLDMVDVDSAKWAQLAGAAHGIRRWIYRREARTLAAFEALACERARTTWVVNERERDALLAVAPGARISVVPNGIDVAAFAPPGPPADNARVLFCGVMDYAPNVQGVLWFAREVWPLVRAQRPDAMFAIVGANPTRAIRELASDDATIDVVGAVSQVQPRLWSSAVAVAPLHLARGLQNKALEAIAAGLPVVLTTAVREGLPESVHRACLRADRPQEFARGVIDLLALTPDERRARAATADLSSLVWEERLRPVGELLADAARTDEPGPASEPRGAS